VLAEAIAMAHTRELRVWEAELNRLQGELLLQQAAETERKTSAETCFRQALEIALTQQAKSLELRAAMSLSRLWQRSGEGAKAYQLLAGCYNWFTEGFDTTDLQETKALLAQLA
jgi:predicted ATPase